jgi:hypothetical protein
MRSIKQIAQQEGLNPARFSVGELCDKFQTGSVTQMIAGHDIAQKYKQIGGFASPLGMPIDRIKNARQTPLPFPNGDGYRGDFRSGYIDIEDPIKPDPTTAVGTYEVTVTFVALECRIRQEGEDEMYGTVGTIVPSTHVGDAHHFPDGAEYWSMGKDNNRIVLPAMQVYKGPVTDLVFTCTLVEHDSGNIDEYKKKVADLIAKAAQVGLGEMGVPSEATAADQGWIGDLSVGLVNSISSALGADDDPYTPQALRITADEISNHTFSKQTLRRSDDPRSTDYTHLMIVNGTDQGGDPGEYGFYFLVNLVDIFTIY